MRTTAKERYEVIARLQRLGISYEDACALRRISMTLSRWGELECGDCNTYGSWAIERDEETYTLCTQCGHKEWKITANCLQCGDVAPLRREGDGKPYMVRHYYGHGTTKDRCTKYRIPDRERGALKRLDAIMKRYPALCRYYQTDPRGAALYILTSEQVGVDDITSIYTRGVAVY